VLSFLWLVFPIIRWVLQASTPALAGTDGDDAFSRLAAIFSTVYGVILVLHLIVERPNWQGTICYIVCACAILSIFVPPCTSFAPNVKYAINAPRRQSLLPVSFLLTFRMFIPELLRDVQLRLGFRPQPAFWASSCCSLLQPCGFCFQYQSCNPSDERSEFENGSSTRRKRLRRVGLTPKDNI
jgi:hypothetical protein